MRFDTAGLPAVAAAMLGLAVPPLAVPATAAAATISVHLCGGGTVDLDVGRKGGTGDPPSGCHAGCAVRRDDDRESCGTGPP